MHHWWYIQGGKQTGPVEYEVLARLIAAGELIPESLVCREGLHEWTRVCDEPRLSVRAPAGTVKPSNLVLAEPGFDPFTGELYPGRTQAYAAFWQRILASAIDFGFVLIVSPLTGVLLFSLTWSVASAIGIPFANRENAEMAPLYIFIYIHIFSWLYFAVQESSQAQTTLGKSMLRLKVMDCDGRRITFRRASGRHFARYLTVFATALVGFVMPLFTDKRQAFHDILAGCIVKEGR